MSPANIQGLNIIHPAPQADSQDLLSSSSFPDLSAQLDLWTNISFETDENSLGSRNDDNATSKYSTHLPDEEEEEVRSPITGEKAIQDGHDNVVTPTNGGTNQSLEVHPSSFDLTTFLAGFGIESYAPHAAHSQQQLPHTALASPSIAQLLALHPPHSSAYIPAQAIQQPQYAHVARPAYPVSATTTAEEFPPSKRPRSNTKTSISAAGSPEAAASPSGPTTLSAAEDKRRRNTAASARFRLKKKEREAALESKAKELETKVNELERECEALRRENGWLKGLVVGVTGAAAGPVVVPQSITPPPTGISAGTKRSRDEDGA